MQAAEFGPLVLAQAMDAMGDLAPERMSGVAVQALVAGLDSESLRILAGLSRSELDEARVWFARTLRELGLPELSRREATVVRAIDIARKIVRGDMMPADGAARICSLAVGIADPESHEFDTFVYAESELDRPEFREVLLREIMEEAERWAARTELPGGRDATLQRPSLLLSTRD